MSSKPTTLNQVAARANVSTSVASGVLNRSRSNGRVSEETRARILAAAEELNYRPNALARSLQRRSAETLGFYTGYGFVDATEPFFAAILNGVQEGCAEHRKDLLIYGVSQVRRQMDIEMFGLTSYQSVSEDSIFARMVSGKIDGLVLTASGNTSLAERLAASHLPAVMIALASPALPSVRPDAAMGARLLADHLTDQGHETILYRGPGRSGSDADGRRAAFQAAMQSQGRTVIDLPVTMAAGPVTAEEDQVLAEAIRRGRTAVACWNDASAYHVLAHCAKRGWRTPDQVGITGFDGLSRPGLPQITTAHAHWAALASAAVALVTEKIEGRPIAFETVLPMSLIIGDTT